jgi:hypothetical protein
MVSSLGKEGRRQIVERYTLSAILFFPLKKEIRYEANIEK